MYPLRSLNVPLGVHELQFGNSCSRELENDLAYASNLSSCDLLSIYMNARSIDKKETNTDDRDEERERETI